MIGRLFFAIFFCLGGFLFYIPKWILMGTKGSRERQQILRSTGGVTPAAPTSRKQREAMLRLEQEQIRLGNWRPRS